MLSSGCFSFYLSHLYYNQNIFDFFSENFLTFFVRLLLSFSGLRFEKIGNISDIFKLDKGFFNVRNEENLVY